VTFRKRFDGAHKPRIVICLAAALWVSALASGLPAQARGVSPLEIVSSNGSRISAASGSSAARSFKGTGETSFTTLSSPGAVDYPGRTWAVDNQIGSDDRVRVNPTTTYPARTVAHITFGNGSLCSGFLIDPNTVATAGHCIERGAGGGFYSTSSYRVTPARNGSIAPYGSCGAQTLFTVNGWANNSDERYDLGAIKLNCSIGNTTGWFGYAPLASPVGKPSLNNGYPGDKPTGTQWKSSDKIRAATANQLFYGNDTYGGLSGSPIYRSTGCGGPCASAIHAYGWGHGAFPHDTWNHGTRITSAVAGVLTTWKNS
jgi:glutamyl endopeptidase